MLVKNRKEGKELMPVIDFAIGKFPENEEKLSLNNFNQKFE